MLKGRPWYQQVGGSTTKLYWFPPQLWLVGETLGTDMAFAYALDTAVTPEKISSTWHASQNGEWVPVATGGVRKVWGPKTAQPDFLVLLVNSAFQYPDRFPSFGTPVLQAEVGYPEKYAISKEVSHAEVHRIEADLKLTCSRHADAQVSIGIYPHSYPFHCYDNLIYIWCLQVAHISLLFAVPRSASNRRILSRSTTKKCHRFFFAGAAIAD